MTTAAMATYPYDQIDRVRADLQRGDLKPWSVSSPYEEVSGRWSRMSSMS